MTRQTPAIEAELTWPQVHAFRLKRHHLAHRAPKKDMAHVVADIGGAQAQVMSAAELQIAARVDCTVADVRRALWIDKTLIKTWLMRGTLHLASAVDLPIYTAAMTHAARMTPAWLKYMQLTEPQFLALANEIGAALNGTPLTREELITAVGKGKSPKVLELLKSGWGGILKPAARSGALCFGPNRGSSVTFVRSQAWLGQWREVDPDEGTAEVARRYLRAYGPATKSDFVRWWGNWRGVGVAAWKGLADELVSVSVEGVRADLLASDLDAVRDAAVISSVQLLPLFDPYLLGHSNRDHLFERAHASKVSRTAGWISAVVLVGGSVKGTWTHTTDKSALRIRVEPFRPLNGGVKAEIRQRAQSLAQALGAADAVVTYN